MIIAILDALVRLYLSVFISFFLHEVGHFGETIKAKKYFPIPKLYSYRAGNRYGGIIVNALVFVGIWYFKPEMFFIQLIGLVSWLHFVIYLILGSFNFEPKVPKILWEYFVFDDIPNRLWWVFVPLAIVAFVYFKSYYLQVAISYLSLLT